MKYSSEQELLNELLELIKINQDKYGLPIKIVFEEGTLIEKVKLNKSWEINTWMEEYKGDVLVTTRAGSNSFWYLKDFPFDKVKGILLHEDYKKHELISNTGKTEKEILAELFNSINLNERKTIVFQFLEKVFLPGYNLLPKNKFTIDVGVKNVSWDKGKTWAHNVHFYCKGNKSKSYYRPDYFPFEKCVGWKFKEDERYASRKKELIKIDKDIEIKICTNKSKIKKEMVVRSVDLKSVEKVENEFPIILVMKFDRLKDRNQNCCLVCGTELRNNNQVYAHLLETGSLTKNPLIKIKNHFQFFPVGSECREYVPNEYLFEKDHLKKVNRT